MVKQFVKVEVPTGVNVHDFMEEYIENAQLEGKNLKNTNFMFLTEGGIAILHEEDKIHYGKYSIKKREDFSDEQWAKMKKLDSNGYPITDPNIH